MSRFDMLHEMDPKDETRERIGPVEGITVTGHQVLVGIYVRPEQTRGGLFLPETHRREDVFQGKVGLVLAVGPEAFVPSEQYPFKVRAEVGDWVVFKVADGWPFRINNDRGDCRMLDDMDVRLIVDKPDRVF